VCEVRLDSVEDYKIGQELGVETFSEVQFVDVVGMSKGKGHQGVIKRHHFAGGPAAHGSGFHRHGGSCGMRTSPGRCLPGQKKSGRMGGEQVTMENLRLVKVDTERHVILVEGAIPGCRGGLVYVTPAKKKLNKVKK
jgi:large subunit ribosomal protein L3